MCRYMGGKGKIGRHISEKIIEIEGKIPIETEAYFEPFVGMCGVMRHMGNSKHKNKKACDYSENIISLWKEVKEGWIPPSFMSRDEVSFQKTQAPSALKCFAAHGTSFGGVYFGSYIGEYNTGKTCIDVSSRSIIRVSKLIMDVEFLSSRSYEDFNPVNETIYCDPPYKTATKSVISMHNFKNFDHIQFWNVMRDWVSKNNIVFISEYTFPSDFVEVWSKNQKINGGKYKVEKLVMHESQAKYCQDNE